MVIEPVRSIFHGHMIDVTVTDTVLPNGVPMTVEAVQHPGAAAVVALDESGNVILIRQFRPVVGEYVIELPAGKRETGEEEVETAARELREETGFGAETLVHLANILSAPGYSTERVALYLARNLVLSQSALESQELVSVMPMPFHEALRLITNGEINDAKTVAGLLLAKALA